jgi:glycosyltransferase involved in cell wall biosynthesis
MFENKRVYRPRQIGCAIRKFPEISDSQVRGTYSTLVFGDESATCTVRNRFDVIHAHAARPCVHAAALISRRWNIPFVGTLHGLDVFNTCFLSGIPAAWRRKVSVNVYRASRTVICISGKVRTALQTGNIAEASSTIVYNGVNPNLFSPSSADVSQFDPEILIVGNLLRCKDHELVLRALGDLRASFPNLRCRIIGEGPDRAQFKTLAGALGIGPQVRFVGRQGRTEVAEAMRRCSVFVLPSRNEGLECVSWKPCPAASR